MKRLNAYFPIWFLLVLPPMLFITLGLNLAICSAGVFLYFYVSGLAKKCKDLFNSIFRLWIVSIVLDVVTFGLMMLPEIFNNIPIIKERLIKPLELNPYSDIVSIIYIIFILSIILLFSKILIKRLVLKKINVNFKNNRIAMIVFTLLSFPYLMFVPSNMLIKTNYESLDDYRGTLISNKTNVVNILNFLETKKYMTSYVLETKVEPYTLNIYLKTIDDNHQVLFEKDASLIFNIIDDVNEVVFHYNDKNYVYTINSINQIYKDVKKKSLVQISKRYENSNFSNYNYLGNINGYDIFDESEFCELEKQYLFSYFNSNYYLNCASLDEIILYKGNEKLSIKDALDKGILTPSDVMNSSLDVNS